MLGLCALLSQDALAINYPLQPEEIQDAYSLGRTSNHEELADFLHQYEHSIQYPADHPLTYVESVEFQTPYEQIALRSLRTLQYTKFQADEDYQANAGLVIVRIVISLNTNYVGPEPPADNFKVDVSQTNSIEPQKMTKAVICDPFSIYSAENACTMFTWDILVRFNVNQFAPGTARIRIETPDGQTIRTKFNLDKLK